MKKILVTGGAGFIASHLCVKLLSLGHEVTAFDDLSLGREEFLADAKKSSKFKFIKADLLDLEAIKSAMKGMEQVWHLAANSDIAAGGLRTDIDLKIGTIATYNVLEAMRLTGVKEIVFSSTSAIYGEATIKPTPENYGPLMPISFYGASKLACEALVTAFCHNFGMKGWIYRFANIVGSHTTHGAIHDFIVKLKRNPASLEVLGDGKQTKSYLHVSDCVEGMLFGVQNSDDEVNLFNLASRGSSNVDYIADQVIKGMNLTAQKNFTGGSRGWKGDVPVTLLDGSRLEKLGWKAKWSSEEAVAQAVRDVIASRYYGLIGKGL
jgi:UDP-glucose 4-epimerase